MKKAKSATSSPRLSDAAVEAKTGKTWQKWFSVLDAAGAACSTEFRRSQSAATARRRRAPHGPQEPCPTYPFKQFGVAKYHERAAALNIETCATLAVIIPPIVPFGSRV